MLLWIWLEGVAYAGKSEDVSAEDGKERTGMFVKVSDLGSD